MKTNKIIAIMATVLIGAGLSSYAVLSGSAHDFSGAGWNSGGEMCLPCHTTHNTISGSAPLWNHASATAANFTPYSSGSMQATPGLPAAASLACLSCHDGVTALDSFGGASGTVLMTGAAVVGEDLTDDHPVSFTYDAALAGSDLGLWDPTATASGLGGNIDADMLFGASNDQLECASCHDVHNDDNNTKLLIVPNTGSALCLTCHNK